MLKNKGMYNYIPIMWYTIYIYYIILYRYTICFYIFEVYNLTKLNIQMKNNNLHFIVI